MAGQFLIADTGEEFITAEWHPDPEVMQAEIITMANKFEDWAAPLEEGRQVMIEATRRRFATETDPDNDPWEPLSDSYEAVRARLGGGEGILKLTGSLEDAATSQDAWFVEEGAIFFNPDVLPRNPLDDVNYGMAHQDGTGERGRQTYPTSSRKKIQAFDALTKAVVGGRELNQQQQDFYNQMLVGGGRGMNLPARPFIGTDEQAEEELIAIFVAHLDNTVTDEWAGLGDITEEFGSNALETLPIIGRLPSGQPRLSSGRFGFK